MAKLSRWASTMKSMSAKDAKNAFGLLLDTARAEPVTVEKHGRPVVVVLSIEEFERLVRRQNTNRCSDMQSVECFKQFGKGRGYESE